MAEGPGSDVVMKIGAVANIKPNEVVAQFRRMSESLAKISTDDAKALGDQISAILQGMADGVVKAEDVADVAAQFAEIKDITKLSDQNIRDFNNDINEAKDNSRALSDYMAKVAQKAAEAEQAAKKQSEAEQKKAESAEKYLSDLKETTADVSPEMGRIQDSFSKWTSRIPGVNTLIGKMSVAAKGVAGGFALAGAAVIAMMRHMNEVRKLVREVQERNEAIASEMAGYNTNNAIANIEQAQRIRARKESDTQAMKEAQNELDMLDMQMSTVYLPGKKDAWADPDVRAWRETQVERKRVEQENDLESQKIDREKKENNTRIQEANEKMASLKNQSKTEQENLDNITKRRMDYEKHLPETFKLARERAQKEGLNEGDKGWMDAINRYATEDLKAKGMDSWKSLLAMTGFEEMSPEEYLEKWKAEADKERAQRQNIRNLTRQQTDVQEEVDSLTAKDKQLGMQEQVLNKRKEAERAKWDMEDKAKEQEMNRGLMERRVGQIAQSNRLTQMGLGGGNVAADSGKQIAGTTKEILAVLKGDIKEGLRAYGKKGLTDTRSMNSTPAMAASAPLGNFGAVWQ